MIKINFQKPVTSTSGGNKVFLGLITPSIPQKIEYKTMEEMSLKFIAFPYYKEIFHSFEISGGKDTEM